MKTSKKDKLCTDCGFRLLGKFFCESCFTCREPVNWKSREEAIEELEKRKKEAISLSYIKDCPSDYQDNVEMFDRMIMTLKGMDDKKQ